MKYTPKFKAMWKGEEYTVTAMHLLEDPYAMLEPRDGDSYGGEEDICVEFSELTNFYEVQPKYYIKLKYKTYDDLTFLYYNKNLRGKEGTFRNKTQTGSYQTQFTYSEIMKLPEEIQNGLNGGSLELEEVE